MKIYEHKRGTQTPIGSLVTIKDNLSPSPYLSTINEPNYL